MQIYLQNKFKNLAHEGWLLWNQIHFFLGGGGQYSYSFKKKNMVQRDAIIGGISICIYKCLYQSLELIWIFEYMYLVQKKSTNSKLPRLYTVLLFYQVIIFKTIWISIFLSLFRVRNCSSSYSSLKYTQWMSAYSEIQTLIDDKIIYFAW